MAKSTASLRAEIKALSGVDIMLNENTFKSTYQIMDELSQKWKDLSDISQATIIELMAGKHQGNVFSSLMQNFDVARDALETSLNSSGSAMAEHAKWSESLEARLNKLKSTWQSLSQTFLKSDFLKGALDAVIGLVDGLTKLIDTLGLFPTLLSVFSIYKSFSGGGFFKPIIDEATGAATGITNIFSDAIRKINNTFKEIGLQKDGLFKTSIEADKKALNEYSEMLKTTTNIDENAFNKIFENASNSAKDFAKSGKLAAEGVDAFVNSQKAAEVATLAQNKSLGNALAITREYYGGCKNVQMSQKDFAAAVQQTNPQLATQLVTSKNAAGAMVGYTASLVGAKVAATALKVAAMALNAALSYGIGILVSFVVEGIMSWINAEEELADKVEEVTSKFKQQHEELQKLKGDYDTSDENSMVSKYEKLSRGVDSLGRNVSLTADEYSEYQSIVNKIADQIPSLVSGYDSQGNALLSCKGNVEELTTAYEKLIHTQNQEILGNQQDINDNFTNTLEDSSGEGLWSNNHGFWARIGSGFGLEWLGDYEMKTDTIRSLENLLDSTNKDEQDKALKHLREYSNEFETQEIRTALQRVGIDISRWDGSGTIYNVLEETLEKEPQKIRTIIDNYYAQFADVVEEKKTIAQAKLSEAFDIGEAVSGLDYGNVSEELQTVARQIVNSMDFEFFENLANDEVYQGDVEKYVTHMLDQLKSLDNFDSKKIEAAFDLQTQFNGGEISYGEYVKGLEDTGKLIDGLNIDEDLKTQIKLSVGLDEKGLVAEYHQLRNRLADSELFNISEPEYESFLEGLSAEELSVLIDIIPELSETDYKETLADIESALKKEMMLQGLTFDLNLEVETAGIEALNTAMAESVSGAGLSSESITALKSRYAELENQGWDLSTMFEETSHGIHLNRQELNKFEKAYASQKLKDVNSDLDEMKATYDELGEQLKTCSDEAKAGIYNDRFTLAQKIAEAATLAAQYEGLTSAYNDWLAAEEAGQERDMYENVISGFETIDDEISRGWYDDSTIEFLEMLTGKDLSTAGIDEIKKAYKGLDKEIKHTSYSVRDFFTVDDEGNSTADGVYNFLDAIGQMEEEKFGGKDIVKRNKNGKIISFDFELAGGDEAIAEALGVSKELVQIMKRAADDAGFVVTLDGSYKQLADLEKEARNAAEYLKSIGKTDFNFDFNTTNVENLNKQLGEAHKILDDPDFWNKDGTFNFEAKGATEAMQIVSTLQAKIDSLTQEKYGIGLTVEDEEFEEPLEKLQNYGRTVATLNQLKLNPEANTEDIEKFEGELENIAKYFAELDGDKKVKLGFDADDNWEEVQKKIESGEVKIPTVLDIQTNMDKNLETLADLALLDSGLLSDNEEKTIKKKYKIDVEADEVDTSDVDDKVDDAVNSSGGKETTRKQNVQIIADVLGVEDVDDLSSQLDGLDDKTIQAIAEVLGRTDVEKLQQTMALIEPKKVQAIAEAIGKGDVDGLKTAISQLDPKTVQAIAEAFGYSDVNELIGAIDNLDPKTVQAVAQALGLGDVNTLQITVNNMHGNTVDAKVNTDGQASKIDTLQTKINSLKGRIVNVGVQIASGGKKKAAQRTGADPAGNDSEVNGTANVNGTIGRAFKQGSWGTKNSGTALVGELGREVLIRQGKYYTVGDYGAEFIRYRRGDIILNHVQSEQLFKNGRVTADGGRAKALVNGTAFNEGYGGKAVGKETETEPVSFDWIETLISRLERAMNNLESTIDSTHRSWKSRNAALDKMIYRIDDEITAQTSAQDYYSGKADTALVDLNSYLKNQNYMGHDHMYWTKVINGRIDTDDIDDEKLAEKIQAYKDWYEKALEAEDAVIELSEKKMDAYAQYFDNVISEYDGTLQIYEHKASMIDEYINQTEAKGHLVSGNYYQALIDNNNGNVIPTLQNEYDDLVAERAQYINNVAQELMSQGMGKLEAYQNAMNSEEADRMLGEIYAVEEEIEKAKTETLEWNNAIRELDWEAFELAQERISAVNDEADFLIDLMANKDLHNDDGSLTAEGMATMGLHTQKYDTHMYQADVYGDKVDKLNAQIKDDPYNQDLINKRNEYLELQRDSILAAEDEKQAIKDLVEEGINIELDALQERIDLHNEELDSMKDLYDYQKNVEEQTENIASLRKQLNAYEGFDDEETKAKVQQLKLELSEAETELQETEYEKMISDTQQMLDALYEEYEETLNTRLDDLDALITEQVNLVNENATEIAGTLSAAADKVGTTLSTTMDTIWAGENGTNSIVKTYGDQFISATNTVNKTLTEIKNGILVDAKNASDTEANTNIGSGGSTSSGGASTSGSSGSGSGSGSGGNKSTGDGKPKIGDKVKFLSGKYYYDSQGVSPAGSKNHEKYVYITNVNNKKWATHPIHISTGKKLGSGDLGWLKKNQISGYATGKKNFLDNEIAWTQENGKEFIVRPSDGAILTPIAKGDSVLNAQASGNIWDMANSPAEFIKDNLNLGVANVPNGSNTQNNIVQNLDKVVFHLPNVKNYDELVSALQKDPKFDKLIKAMTIDQIAGKSSLAKNKSIR